MKFTPVALFVLIGAPLLSQVSMTVGPSPAPVGAAIAISVANDAPKPVFLATLCPFRVRNEAGGEVFTPKCFALRLTVEPGSVYTAMWDQVDDSGRQVPPGTYLVDVFFAGGTSTSSLVIDAATHAAIADVGAIRAGSSRSFYLAAPGSTGMPYMMAASFAGPTEGIQTCGGVVPLATDALLELSLGPNPFFSNFSGVLEGMPTSTSPAVSLPNEPALAGVKFVLVFVVLDPGAACPVRTISAPHLVAIR